MKKRLFCTIIASLLIVGSIAAMTVNVGADEIKKTVITIDPGHGGDDPGNTKAATLYANGDKSHYESRHTYDISMYVKERLLQYLDVEVYMTRGDLDEDAPCPSLASRPNIALEHGSDAFVSIHTNVYDTTVRGSEIHVPSKSISFNNSVATTSYSAAEVVLSKMVSTLGTNNRNIKYNLSDEATYSTGEQADKLQVLRQGRINNIPVVMLIETAFADNADDFESYLSTTEKRKSVGYAIADGLAEYYGLQLISEAVTPYFCEIQSINGITSRTYSGSLDEGVIAIDATDVGLPSGTEQTLSISGWMGLEGGAVEYLYTIDHGEWISLSGGADGEPSRGFYASQGLSGATQKGLFNTSDSLLSIDLSYYEGQKISVTLAARSARTNKIVPFLTFANYIVPIIIPKGLGATYGDTLSDIELPLGWSWTDPNASVGNAGERTVSAKFTAKDSTVYNIDLDLTVSKADPEYTVPTGLSGQFMAKLGTISLPNGWTWSNSNYMMDELGEMIFKATFTPKDKNNYNTVSVNIPISVACTTHRYDNDCDTDCECGFTREIEHTYTNACDAVCDICSFERTPSEHEYSNECDIGCNVCGEIRSVTHVYSDDSDSECNVCGAVRAVATVSTANDGCGSTVSGLSAIVISLAIAFFIVKKRK